MTDSISPLDLLPKRGFFSRLFCAHRFDVFIRNIYGDEIYHCGYKRSVWGCSKCGDITAKPHLQRDCSGTPL